MGTGTRLHCVSCNLRYDTASVILAVTSQLQNGSNQRSFPELSISTAILAAVRRWNGL